MLNSDIYLKDIQPLNESMGLVHQNKNTKQLAPLMTGDFSFRTFVGGLSMHASKAIERQDSDSALELPPGLSFNIVFNGRIGFSFGGNQYEMINDSEKQPATCTAIINDKVEILTRHMTKDVLVEKLNIFVERKWLLDRCNNNDEQDVLHALFCQSKVIHWTPSRCVLFAAHKLLKIKTAKSFTASLELETQTIKLLSLLLEDLKCTKQQYSDIVISKKHSQDLNSLKSQVDQLLSTHYSIEEVASALNMSNRTLQRRFKSLYKIPASNYIKQRKMEIAKKSLLIDNLSIGETSFNAGYKHPSNFVSAFKKLYGLTPTEYKRMHQFN